jgi:phospholipase/carboxylesterase
MHGLGADGNDFVPIVQELDLRARLTYVSCFLTHRCSGQYQQRYVMRAWYDVRWGDLEGRSKQADEEGVRPHKRNRRADEGELAKGIPAEKIVLAGFSQGGAIALQTGLRYGKRSPESWRYRLTCRFLKASIAKPLPRTEERRVHGARNR